MRRLMILCALVCLGGSAWGFIHDNNKAPEGFTALFNGNNLDGWRGRPDLDPAKEAAMTAEDLAARQKEWNADLAKHWSVDVEKGEIVNDGKGPFLCTTKEYGNFELQLDWKLANKNADSGVFLRGYPQVQIWDPDNPVEAEKGGGKGSGGLFNNKPDSPGHFPLVKVDKAVGEWNTYQIIMVGSRVWVRLNGKLTVDGATLENSYKIGDAILPKGPIILQSHVDEVRFRNIYIREIGKEEANKATEKK